MNNTNAFTLTITDINYISSDQRIKETIKKNFRGFPDYLVYIDGKPVNKEISGRTVEDLKKFSGM